MRPSLVNRCTILRERAARPQSISMPSSTRSALPRRKQMPAALPRLFSPLTLGGITLRNRIVSTAHSTGLSEGVEIGDRVIAYYAARARGGVGLVITGSTSVHPSSTSKLMPALANWDETVIER